MSKEKLIKYINEMYLPNVSGSGKAQEYWSKFGKWIEYNLQKSSDVDFFDSIVKLTGNIKHDMAKKQFVDIIDSYLTQEINKPKKLDNKFFLGEGFDINKFLHKQSQLILTKKKL
ncbi:MAG: hypothetical protein HC932_04760 [Thermales bacterium]|nr:hypothetical protein [Thermales bacterium]